MAYSGVNTSTIFGISAKHSAEFKTHTLLWNKEGFSSDSIDFGDFAPLDVFVSNEKCLVKVIFSN